MSFDSGDFSAQTLEWTNISFSWPTYLRIYDEIYYPYGSTLFGPSEVTYQVQVSGKSGAAFLGNEMKEACK